MTDAEFVALYQHPDSVPPITALRELDRVDWAALSHAYGPATDVPALLRALVSPTSEHRNYALQGLFETIWHQGTVYPATAAVVPILLDLLQADSSAHKPAVVVLLSAIAEGRPPFARCENNPEEAERWRKILAKSGRSLDAELAEGRRFFLEIRRRIQNRFDELYPYVRDPDPEVRRSVVIALGCYPAIVMRLLPDLQSLLEREQEEYVRRALRGVIDRAQVTR